MTHPQFIGLTFRKVSPYFFERIGILPTQMGCPSQLIAPEFMAPVLRLIVAQNAFVSCRESIRWRPSLN